MAQITHQNKIRFLTIHATVVHFLSVKTLLDTLRTPHKLYRSLILATRTTASATENNQKLKTRNPVKPHKEQR